MEQNQPTAEQRAGKGRRGKILLRAAAGLLILALLLSLALWVIPMTEKAAAEELRAENSTKWMAKLPNDVRLDKLILPGTHASAARYVPQAFFGRYQSLSVLEQLNAGFRVLDLELVMDGDRLKLASEGKICKTGPMPWSRSLDLEEVLSACYAFVEIHPTETVILSVGQEDVQDQQSAERFEACLQQYISKRPELWLLSDKMPWLYPARGKLVLMRRLGDRPASDSAGFSILWPEPCEIKDLIQELEGADPKRKSWLEERPDIGESNWNNLAAGMESAWINYGKLSLHLLTGRGSGLLDRPYTRAGSVNQSLMEIPSEELSGWFILDFASAPLAEHIWKANRFEEE